MSIPTQEKQRILEAEQLNIQLENIERRMHSLARSRAEATDLLATLSRLPEVKDGDELLVPVATGLFVPAKGVSSDRIVVNVGAGVTVEKTVAEVRAMIQEKIASFETHERELQERFETGVQRLTQLQAEFKK